MYRAYDRLCSSLCIAKKPIGQSSPYPTFNIFHSNFNHYQFIFKLFELVIFILILGIWVLMFDFWGGHLQRKKLLLPSSLFFLLLLFSHNYFFYITLNSIYIYTNFIIPFQISLFNKIYIYYFLLWLLLLLLFYKCFNPYVQRLYFLFCI